MNFKVGDWLRTPDNEIVKLLELDLAGYRNKLSDGYMCFNWYLESCTIWEPKKDEWCWFYDSNIQPQLGKSTGVNPGYDGCEFFMGNVTYPFDKTHLVEGFNYCEPFIGQLPTCLKD